MNDSNDAASEPSTPQPAGPVDLVDARLGLDDMRAVFAQLDEGLILSDTSGGIVHWNRAALAMHELTPDTSLQRPVEDFADLYELRTPDGELLPVSRWPVPRLLRGEVVRNEPMRLVRRDRPWSRTFCYSGSIVSGGTTGSSVVVLHVRDITAQVEAQRTVARQSELQGMLFHCSQRLAGIEPLEAGEARGILENLGAHFDAEGVALLKAQSDETLELVTSIGRVANELRRISAEPTVAAAKEAVRAAWGTSPTNTATFALQTPTGQLLGVLTLAARVAISADDEQVLRTVTHMFSAAAERASAAKATRENELRLRLLLQQVPVMVWSVDRDLRITFVGGARLSSSGLASRMLPGRLVHEVVPGQREVVRSRHLAAMRGELVSFEDRVDHVVLRGSLTALYDDSGAITGAVGYAEDVTERARASEAALEAMSNLARAQRVSHTGSFEFDVTPEGAPAATHRWSDEAYRIYGYPVGSVTPTMDLVASHVHPEDRDALLAHPFYTDFVHDFRIVRRDDVIRHVRVRYEVSRDANTGRPLKAIGAISDITDLKVAQAEVLRLNADLERRVTERTAELRAANEELQAFAYAVAHDLRAPLRAMEGFSRALEEEYESALGAEGREYLGEIIGASRKMDALIDALLALSRTTRPDIRQEPVDISALCHEVLRELSATEPGRTVDARVEPDLRVRGDARMMASLMRNLVGNAWKYTARNADAEIRVFAEQRDGSRWVVVRDNGAGFSMSHAQKLFVPFQRLHREDEFPGIGIGLATASRIVSRHGGTIAAEAAPGQGATFRFTLPSLAAESSPTEELPA
jgi:PAS domain S-box-containing protein